MIAILPTDFPPPALDELRGELEARGWRCEVSRGQAQIVLTVAGPPTPQELEDVLASRVVAEVVPLESGDRYAARRRWRRVMHGIAWGLFLLLVFGLGVPAVAFVRSPVDSLVGPERVLVGSLEKLPTNSGRLVRIGRKAVLLVRLDFTRLFALGAICTHMDDCQLEWNADRQQIVCPCHGCTYDVYGNVVSGPPSVPLTSFAVQVLGDRVYVGRDR